MTKVYVSSTIADLESERRAVFDWLEARGHQPLHSYRPDSETIRDSCLDDVDKCDLYVLILGIAMAFNPKKEIPRNYRSLISSSDVRANQEDRASRYCALAFPTAGWPIWRIPREPPWYLPSARRCVVRSAQVNSVTYVA